MSKATVELWEEGLVGIGLRENGKSGLEDSTQTLDNDLKDFCCKMEKKYKLGHGGRI